MAKLSEQEVVTALAALAQIHRLKVFRQLVVSAPDGLYPGDLGKVLDVMPNSLSFHLKELQRCGLVTQEREGRYLRYRADIGRMQSLLNYLLDQCCQGISCIGPVAANCKPRESPIKSAKRKRIPINS